MDRIDVLEKEVSELRKMVQHSREVEKRIMKMIQKIEDNSKPYATIEINEPWYIGEGGKDE